MRKGKILTSTSLQGKVLKKSKFTIMVEKILTRREGRRVGEWGGGGGGIGAAAEKEHEI